MPDFPRYALYYVPARETALYRFGSETLGYDAFTGDDIAFAADVTARMSDWSGITADPRRYGFHATLKAPFALIDGRGEAELATACAAFCAQPRDIPRIEVSVAAISGFIALVPTEPRPPLERLAGDVVEVFDTFRAPLSPRDRARRNPSKLTERQIAYLDRWGYPYVMDEFRFHMTLTGRLAHEPGETIKAMLSRRFSETCLATLAVDRIALFRQDSADARFRVISEYALTAAHESPAQASGAAIKRQARSENTQGRPPR